jgi:AcrR family transcriptional regulator
MTRKRLPGTERKTIILEAARKVFAECGYEGAKTQQIAKAAKISEALVYRHFPSKLALYRAVLRQLVREQDENLKMMELLEPSTAGIVESIRNYVETALAEREGRIHEGNRMMLASLAGEGGYVSLIYRRAHRKMHSVVAAALDAAWEAGDMSGRRIAPENFSAFVEHIGTMLNMAIALPGGYAPYDNSDARLARDAVWFCCRGVGLTDEAIRRYYGD